MENMIELSRLCSRYDVPAPRYTSYPTVPAWSDAFGPADYRAALARSRDPISLYVHIPFCQHRCLFCGCNVVIARHPERADLYLDHLAEELRLAAGAIGGRRTIRSMHWGGGTPTFLDEARLIRLYESIEDYFDFAGDATCSVEIDPRVTSRGQLELLRALGFDRVSMGVQDFDEQVQSAIGREQPATQTESLLETARRSRYASVNFDLIYGLPRQTIEGWRSTLDKTSDMGPDRIALFAMAYVPSVKPHQKRLPIVDMPQGEQKLALFEEAVDHFTSRGYQLIGMDHFARSDDALAVAARTGRLSRNFQGYHTDGDVETIGVGASSISDVGGAFAQNEVALAKYYRAIASGDFATQKGMVRTADDDRRGTVIRDLMCRFTADVGPGFSKEITSLSPLEADGLVRIAGTRIDVTELGRRFVRQVAMAFDAHRVPEAVHARGV